MRHWRGKDFDFDFWQNLYDTLLDAFSETSINNNCKQRTLPNNEYIFESQISCGNFNEPTTSGQRTPFYNEQEQTYLLRKDTQKNSL